MKRSVLAILAAVLFLTACGGSAMETGGTTASSDRAWAEAPEEAVEWDASYGSENRLSAPASPAPDAGESGVDQPRKLIRTAELNMETLDFQETETALTQLTERLGGYFASVSAGDRNSSYRWSSYTIRVPEAHFQSFLDQAGELCHETYRHVDQEDISERYYDTEGRLRTQRTKLTRLQALLERAENMEDIISIMSAISETEEAIEELAGTLSHYDNLVDYATIELSLSEVYRYSNTEVLPENYGSRLGNAFLDGLRDFGGWLEDLTVGLAYSWMWWALLALAVFGVVKLRRARGGGKLPFFHRKDKNAQAAPPSDGKP